MEDGTCNAHEECAHCYYTLEDTNLTSPAIFVNKKSIDFIGNDVYYDDKNSDR